MIISPKVKELIAIGTSVGIHCDPCLQYHIQQARTVGVSEDEILEAINIGKQVERGAIDNMQKRVEQLIKVKSNKKGTQTLQASCRAPVDTETPCCSSLDDE